MNLDSTGVLYFNWDSPNVDHNSIYVDTYINDGFLSRASLSSSINSFTVSGLNEGASCYLSITPLKGGSRYNDNIIYTDTQTVPVSQYADPIGIDSLILNGETLNLIELGNNTYSGQTKYLGPDNSLVLNLSSPRDSGVFKPKSDPLFDKISFNTFNKFLDVIAEDSSSYRNVLDNSTDLKSNHTSFTLDPAQLQQISLNIYDIHGTYSTAIVDLEFEPYKIDSVYLSIEEETDDGKYIYNANVTMDNRASYYDFLIYSDVEYSQLIVSGRSNNNSYAEFEIDNSVTGYSVFIPYNDLLSGAHYVGPILYPKPPTVYQDNILTEFSIDETDYSFTFNSSYNLRSNSTSTIQLQIFRQPEDNGSQDPIFFDLIPSGGSVTYDSLNNFTGQSRFYYIVDLINDESGYIEDFRSGYFEPDFLTLDAEIFFDNFSGITQYTAFTNKPSESVQIQFSGKDYSDYVAYIDPIKTREKYASGTFRLINNTNQYIHDEVSVSGSAPDPILQLVTDGWSEAFTKTYNFSITTMGYYGSVNLYAKDAAVYISGELPSSISNSFSFDDFDDYDPIKYLPGPGPQNIDLPLSTFENSKFDIVDDNYTGSYYSGKYKSFLVSAVDGYGVTGYSNTLTLDGLLNDVTESLYNIISDSNSTTSVNEITLSNVVNNQSFTFRENVASGIDRISLNYSSLNLSESPSILHNVISPDVNYPILASQTAGLPGTGSALVIFSDDIPSTGFLIDLLIQPRV